MTSQPPLPPGAARPMIAAVLGSPLRLADRAPAGESRPFECAIRLELGRVGGPKAKHQGRDGDRRCVKPLREHAVTSDSLHS